MFFDNFSQNLFGLAIALLILAITYYKWSFGYWKRKGLDTLDPSFPFGNCRQLFLQQKSFSEQFYEFYMKFKQMGKKHGGVYFFSTPIYVPTDQEIIKCILQKDFDHFVDRGVYHNEKVDPLSCHLFSLEGAKWKDLRVKLTPTFTSGKMKMMFSTMANCTKGLHDILQQSETLNTPLDIKEILSRFTTDVISSCAFGLESSSLKNPNSKFRKYGQRIIQMSTFDNMKNLAQFIFPHSFLKFINFKLTKSDVEDFFINLVKKNSELREKNNIYRKDFFHLLLQLKNRGKVTDDEKIEITNTPLMTMGEFAAQAFIFFVAGFETSSTTMNFALFELAQNSELQEKTRKEIKHVLAKHNNEITYDAIMEMKYLDCLINETLRKYGPVGTLIRLCTKAYTIPNTTIRLEKGTQVVISTIGVHYDPEFYPNPEKFDPERFNDENKNKIPQMAHIPFGEGPRICIGLRFGILQSKVGLVAILKDYKMTLNRQLTELPLVYDKKTFLTATEKPIFLNVEKIN